MIIRNTLITAIAFIMLQLVNAGLVRAQDNVIELKPVEISGTRSLLTTLDTPSSVTVITEEEIEQKQHATVEDLLRGELGLDVAQNGPMGGSTSVFMRSGGSSSTLVMVDGIQVNLNTSGGFNFAHLTTDNIERVEILRGPQSTLWGADAVGGVINIVTKTGEEKPSHSIAFEGGSFATFKETASSSGRIKEFDYSVSVSRTDSDGFSSASEARGNTENDGYENTSLSTRLGYEFTEDGRVEVIAHYIRAIAEFDAFSFSTSLPTDGDNGSKTSSFYIATPLQKTFAGFWDVKLTPSFVHDEVFSFDPSFSNSHVLNRTYTLDLQNNLELTDFLNGVFGMEYQVQNGVNEEQSQNRTLYNQGYFAQAQLHYQNRAFLTAGFRHDINSTFENKTTYKVDGAYLFRKTGTRIRAGYSTGFRAPTFNDLFFFPPFVNPDLKPEEVENWEVGFNQDLLDGRLRLAVTYFDADYTNLIQLDSSFVPQNIGKATSQGIESEIDFQLTDDLDVSLRHTWNQAEDDNGGSLIRRAKQKFHADLHHNWRGKLDSIVGVYVRSGTRDNPEDTGTFTTIRAALKFKVNPNLTITLRGENLLDEDYEEIPGFGTAGISGYAGFVYDF